ncbi:MAG: enoyl-CoA hydratase [Proteobacteria bacterium]|nr:enoyl-CoA hydratase [Pseudomonadota bacterium]
MNVRPTDPRAPPAAAITRATIDHIAIITLDDARGRNCLSEAMLAGLTEAFARIAADKDVRAVVIEANGPAFCAGHDLKEMTAHRADADRGHAYAQALMRACSTLMTDIVRLPQPVIAAVEGVATAAGCQLVASCDLAVASASATFATPGVHIGLFCSTPMVALTRNVAPKHAMEMLLTGEAITAEDARRIGLVNRVVALGTARAQALALARAIAAQSTAVVRLGKEAFYRQREMPLTQAYAYAGDVMVANMLAPDAEEGIGAFIEKRAPNWQDC